MKRIISIAVALLLGYQTTQSQTNNPVAPQSVILCGFVVTCVLVGCVFVIYINRTCDLPRVRADIEIQESKRDGIWTTVQTITNVVLCGTNPVSVYVKDYSDTHGDECTIYRAKVIQIP